MRSAARGVIERRIGFNGRFRFAVSIRGFDAWLRHASRPMRRGIAAVAQSPTISALRDALVARDAARAGGCAIAANRNDPHRRPNASRPAAGPQPNAGRASRIERDSFLAVSARLRPVFVPACARTFVARVDA
ncbi:hypothetical protein WS72_07825 [Burkholderia savannae]|uniref:Uncharacterized protein n=1 Tax=Burkholderia savannae TaxID=1637837 RepID=A0ABR5TCR2_9BURK|nr:hypothetical protein WS72_07825 [Burkholderia savannae]